MLVATAYRLGDEFNASALPALVVSSDPPCILLGLYCVIDRRNYSFGAFRFILGEMIEVFPRIMKFGIF